MGALAEAPGKTEFRPWPRARNPAPKAAKKPVYEVRQATADLPTLLAQAEQDRPDLEMRLRRLAVDTPGLLFPDAYPPRVKTDAKGRITQKLQERPADAWVDYLGGRLWVERPQDMPGALQAVADEFPLLDLDNFLERPTPGGYRAIHVTVETPSGLRAEIQIVPEPVGRVQDQGWKVYARWRDRDIDTLTPEELVAREADLARSRAILDPQYAAWQARRTAEAPPPEGSVGAAAARTEAPPTDENLVLNVTGRAGGDRGTNLDRLDTTEDVKRLYSQLHQQHAGLMAARRRGSMTLEEITRLAQEAGLDEARIRARVLGGTLNAEQITQARDILVASAERLNGLKEEYRRLQHEGQTIPDALVDRFASSASHHIALQAEVEGATTEIARALAAHRILARSGRVRALQTPAVQAAVEAFGGLTRGEPTGRLAPAELAQARARAREVLDLAAAIPDTDPTALGRFLRRAQQRRWGDRVYEAWLASILSGPPTHLANMVGNTLFALTTTGERALAGGIDAALAGLTGRRREVFAREGTAELAGMFSALTSGRALGKAILAWQQEGLHRGKLETHPPAIPGGAGRIIRAPLRALSAEDAFAKAIIFEAELQAGATRLALQEGRQGEALARRIAALIDDPTPGLLIRAKAQMDARTFNQPLGHFGQTVMRLRERHPVLKYIVPFVRTPTNIAKATLERTPLGFVPVARRALRGEYVHGQPELGGVPRTLAEDLARPIMGSLIMAGVGALAAAGYVTGGGGAEDRKVLAAKREAGWQPYSVVIPGVGAFAYNRLEPVGSLMGMAADVVDLVRTGQDAKATQLAQAMLGAVAQNLTNKTFLVGLLGLSNLVADPSRYAESWIEGQVRGFVPAGGLLASIARATDRTERDTRGALGLRRAQGQIPGLRNLLPERQGVLGGRLESAEPAVMRALSPIRFNRERPEKAAEREVARVGAVPGPAPRTLKIEGQEVPLTPDERRAFTASMGARARDGILEALDSSAYWELGREEQAQTLRRLVDRARQEATRDLRDGLRERVAP